jgi:hypothetical protein
MFYLTSALTTQAKSCTVQRCLSVGWGPATKARTGALRRHLINIPTRIARGSRRLARHLPARWPHADTFHSLFAASHAPPAAA